MNAEDRALVAQLALDALGPNLAERMIASLSKQKAQATHPSTPTVRYVYVVQSGGLIKIGSTQNVNRRVTALRTGSAHNVRVLHRLHGGPLVEKALHGHLSQFRLHGEWFTVEALSRVRLQDAAEDQGATCGCSWCAGTLDQVLDWDHAISPIEPMKREAHPSLLCACFTIWAFARTPAGASWIRRHLPALALAHRQAVLIRYDEMRAVVVTAIDTMPSKWADALGAAWACPDENTSALIQAFFGAAKKIDQASGLKIRDTIVTSPTMSRVAIGKAATKGGVDGLSVSYLYSPEAVAQVEAHLKR